MAAKSRRLLGLCNVQGSIDTVENFRSSSRSLIAVSGTSHAELPPSFLAPCLRQNFSTTPAAAAHRHRLRIKGKHMHDVYAIRQAELRKEANVSRQALIKEQRQKDLGDPIRGLPTPFVKSFDFDVPQDAASALESANITVEAVINNPDEAPSKLAQGEAEKYLDHGLDHQELADALQSSRTLTEPLPPANRQMADRMQEKADREKWKLRDETATEAIQRIASLANANSKHRTKQNIKRIVETFGRHVTDSTLRPKAPPNVDPKSLIPPTPRTGPDTGSSEVQIGILTAKIRVLADRYEGEGRGDKVNKRNLRLLLHRRQKLLKYMERKERGSERWRHMLETLGLTPATWRGEIAVQ